MKLTSTTKLSEWSKSVETKLGEYEGESQAVFFKKFLGAFNVGTIL